MKSLKVSDVVYGIFVELAKKKRMKLDSFMEEVAMTLYTKK